MLYRFRKTVSKTNFKTESSRWQEWKKPTWLNKPQTFSAWHFACIFEKPAFSSDLVVFTVTVADVTWNHALEMTKSLRWFHHAYLPCEPSKDVLNVRVVSTRLGDGDAQLSVAQCPDGCDDARDDPDNQCEAHRAGILHHALRTDKDTWANDVTWWNKTRISSDLSFSLSLFLHCNCFKGI